MTTPDYRLSQLETLEAESIHVIREVVAELERLQLAQPVVGGRHGTRLRRFDIDGCTESGNSIDAVRIPLQCPL